MADHNLPNQFFRLKDVDRPKVKALYEIVEDFTGSVLDCREVFYDKTHKKLLRKAVIVCVDNMDARRDIWKDVKNNPRVSLFIDTRMAAEVAAVYTIDPLDSAQQLQYESVLWTEEESLPDRCTAQSIVYTVLGLSAIVAGKVKKWVMHQPISTSLLRDFVLTDLTSDPAFQSA